MGQQRFCPDILSSKTSARWIEFCSDIVPWPSVICCPGNTTCWFFSPQTGRLLSWQRRPTNWGKQSITMHPQCNDKWPPWKIDGKDFWRGWRSTGRYWRLPLSSTSSMNRYHLLPPKHQQHYNLRRSREYTTPRAKTDRFLRTFIPSSIIAHV